MESILTVSASFVLGKHTMSALSMKALVHVLAFVNGGQGGFGASLAADLEKNTAIRNQKTREACGNGKEPCCDREGPAAVVVPTTLCGTLLELKLFPGNKMLTEFLIPGKSPYVFVIVPIRPGFQRNPAV